jgi:uncharacterized OsmC-like protein
MIASSDKARETGPMSDNPINPVVQRQEPLRRRYRERPELAEIADHARAQSPGHDPFHGSVTVGDSRTRLEFGIHRAVGGDHDLPNPGDMLCAALAACLDSTMRMIAARLGVGLRNLEVDVRAIADVRGCLMVDRAVPAGFKRIEVNVLIEPEDGADPAAINILASTAEQCCVVLQTLRGDVPVETRFSGTAVEATAE